MKVKDFLMSTFVPFHFMPAVYRCLMRLMVIFLKAPAPRWGGRGDD